MSIRWVHVERTEISTIALAAVMAEAGCVGLPPGPPADDAHESDDPTPGSTASTDAVIDSSTAADLPPEPVCGDGITEANEICDDGNEASDDGCSADCSEARCLVPVTHATVQGAIDDVGCPTVWVSAGTYFELLTIDHDVSLHETDNGDVVIDAGELGRPLTVGAGAVVVGTLRLTGGLAEDGGGVHSAADLVLDGTEVSGNRSVGVGIARGGGVFNGGGSLTLVGARIVENIAEPTPGLEMTRAAGGGIFSEGGNVQLLANSEISANQAVAVGLAPLAEGGGLHTTATQVSGVGDVRIGDNLAVAEQMVGVRLFIKGGPMALGGGLYLDDSSLEMSGGLVEANQASSLHHAAEWGYSGARSEGGGVALRSSTGTFDGTNLLANLATATSDSIDEPSGFAYGGGLSAMHGSTVTVTNATVAGNRADASITAMLTEDGGASAHGGGLYGRVGTSTDTVTIDLTDCMVNGNRALATAVDPEGSTSAWGGAAYISSGTGDSVINLSFERSLVVGNVAEASTARAGGVYATTGTGNAQTWLVAVNSTFSGNEARTNPATTTAVGGAFYVYGGISLAFTHVRLFNTTITENVAGQAGGLYLGSGQRDAVLLHSIVQGNSATLSPDLECLATPIGTTSHNLIGSTGECSFTGTGDLTGQDALLLPLADNGGPTPTHAFDPMSLAHDGGNPTGCTDPAGNPLIVDQRGEPRPSEVTCDIGAFEYQP